MDSLPYPMTGLDFDNGGEFINVQLIEWAQQHRIDLTKARAYQHNDNAHVEQRNRDWVHRELNPAQITRRINQVQGQLMTRARLRARAGEEEFGEHFR